MLFYILSCLGSISRGLALLHAIQYHLALAVTSISRGIACYPILYHALAVSSEAWHAIQYHHALAMNNFFKKTRTQRPGSQFK